MVSDAFRFLAYPVTGDARERPLLAGWIFVLFALVVPVLPLLPVVGYLVRVLLASADEASNAPAFLHDGFELVRLGVGATAVIVAYLAVPAVALVITVHGVVETGRIPEGFVETVTFFSGTTAVLFLSLVSSYLLPIAVVEYGRTRRLRAAFAPGTIGRLARSAHVFLAWTVALVTTAVGCSIALELLAFPRVGPVLAAPVLVYTSILAVHRLGVGVARATN